MAILDQNGKPCKPEIRMTQKDWYKHEMTDTKHVFSLLIGFTIGCGFILVLFAAIYCK